MHLLLFYLVGQALSPANPSQLSLIDSSLFLSVTCPEAPLFCGFVFFRVTKERTLFSRTLSLILKPFTPPRHPRNCRAPHDRLLDLNQEEMDCTVVPPAAHFERLLLF
ncbi:hypothetical protein SBA4_3970007 [Candidatus Sulfopaludibacter sp. SbA4]|nr:hypothetical protein SBA4_3970007 [Candidatus Sulfopaludibacter sp. SbA4]